MSSTTEPPAQNRAPVTSAARDSRNELVPLSDRLPPNLALLPVSQNNFFPGMVVPVILPEGKLVKTVERVMEGSGFVGVVVARDPNAEAVAQAPSSTLTGLPSEHPLEFAPVKGSAAATFYRYGIAAKILKKINLPDNQISVLLAGLQRFHVNQVVTSNEDLLVGNVEYHFEEINKGVELEALLRSAITQFKQLSKDNPLISEEVKVALVNVDGPGKLADFMASVLIRDVGEYQQFLACQDVTARLHRLLLILKKEQDVQSVQRKIQEEVNQKLASQQKEYYLQEQLKQIQKELGRTDSRQGVVEKLKTRLAGKSLNSETQKRVDEEFDRLGSLHEQSSEYSVAINYLDWVTSLPWGVRSPENYSLNQARKILNRDHHGLEDVKKRILEFLAVRKLKQNSAGSIICFVGPPGTGKTSLGKSIAAALERKFFRFSVGGMRDEAEIKGHRRTYVGAMPGKIIQGLKRTGTQNPVFLIDEIDKIGSGWVTGGDPSSALLEVLDSEQNKDFLDHYLDIPFDCSEVFFITTANSLDTIPGPLLDRMEIIPLHGYTDSEKMQIARNYLIPKQLEKNAIGMEQFYISDTVLHYLITHYARESGVRNLEKQIAKLARKAAFSIASAKKKIDFTDLARVRKALGPPPFQPDTEFATDIPGVATGLAWTQYGGEVLHIESAAVPGRGGFVLTGTLGKVMQESANIAYTFIRGLSKELNISKHFFDRHVFHLHVPAGAIPKDGPSAGVTIAASLYSLLANKPLPKKLAMTGELTLSGTILPVGGIKEKLLAAKRANIKTVFLPSHNAPDLKALEPEVRKGIQITQVSTMNECLRNLFGSRRVTKAGSASLQEENFAGLPATKPRFLDSGR